MGGMASASAALVSAAAAASAGSTVMVPAGAAAASFGGAGVKLGLLDGDVFREGGEHIRGLVETDLANSTTYDGGTLDALLSFGGQLGVSGDLCGVLTEGGSVGVVE
jgi:hypothetical protein